MSSTLNTELFAEMLKNKRGEKGLRTVAEEIGGVSYATLSRVEQGKIPDVNTFIRICKWMEVSSDTFIEGEKRKRKEKSISTREHVVAQLRADRELSKDSLKTLLNVIDLAYNTK
jgi:transcriptional regulator with XRE-family HTH domain